MFETYTEKAIKVIRLAQEEARRLGRNFVGSEQILIGLIAEGTGIASLALISRGIDLASVRREVELVIGQGPGFVAPELTFTARTERILEFSVQESQKQGLYFVDTEHLLLGLLKEGEGGGINVLCRISGEDILSIHDQLDHIIEALNYKIDRGKTRKYTRQQKFESAKYHRKSLRVMRLAEEESRRLGHNVVGTEQILVGLIEEDTGLAAQVLKSMDVDLEKIRNIVEQVIGHGRGTQPGEIPLTPAAERLLQLSAEEAKQLNHKQINTEHILLGIIRLSEETAR